MTKQDQIINKAQAKLNMVSIDQLKEVATITYADDSDEAGFALDMALQNLESRMDEEAFCEFCEELDAA